MANTLTDIYKEMLNERSGVDHKRDITASTPDVVGKAHPKSGVVSDFEQELFGLSAEELKGLPLKSLETLHSALQHLLSRTQEDPMLRQALRRMISQQFQEADGEEEGEEEPIADKDMEAVLSSVKEESIDYRSIVSQFGGIVTEATKAQRFNYKRLLDIEDKKINDPAFLALLNTFDLADVLVNRMQRQGVLIFLKKLAALAETNQMIAQALTKLIRIENAVADKKDHDPAGQFGESVELDTAMIVEGLADSEVSPTSLLTDFRVGAVDQAKKDALAQAIFAYDKKFMERNAGKSITWKVVEAAFNHNKAYLQQLFQFIVKNPKVKEDFVQKVSTITRKPTEVVGKVL